MLPSRVSGRWGGGGGGGGYMSARCCSPSSMYLVLSIMVILESLSALLMTMCWFFLSLFRAFLSSGVML